MAAMTLAETAMPAPERTMSRKALGFDEMIEMTEFSSISGRQQQYWRPRRLSQQSVASYRRVRALARQGKRNFISAHLKYTLFAFNFLFCLAGMFILSVGIIAVVMNRAAWQRAGRDSGVRDAISLMMDLTVLFIMLGSVVLVIAFAGCVGSLRENVRLLKFYSFCLFLIFFTECTLVLAITVMKEKAIAYIESLISEGIVSKYRKEGYIDTRNFIDWYHINLKCCGASSYRDWNNSIYFTCSRQNRGPDRCSVPYSCCKKMNDIDEKVINTQCGNNMLRNEWSTDKLVSHQIHTIGCVRATRDYFHKNIKPILVTAAIISLIHLSAVLLARVLAVQIHDQVMLLHMTGQMY